MESAGKKVEGGGVMYDCEKVGVLKRSKMDNDLELFEGARVTTVKHRRCKQLKWSHYSGVVRVLGNVLSLPDVLSKTARTSWTKLKVRIPIVI
jgi:hypothetical protein